MNMLRIGLAQCVQSDDFEANARTILRSLEDAASHGVQVLCFPETQTVGYRVDIARPDTPVPVDQLADLHDLVARRCGQLGMACVLGTETPRPENPRSAKPYNSALVVSERGEILGTHHKTKLTPLDRVAYSPGSDLHTFSLFGVTVGVVICFEGFRFPETTRECVRRGARVVFHPQNNTTRPNDWKIPIHHAMIVTRAAENTIWFASCNLCHPDHQNCRSMVVAPNGVVVGQSELKRPELVVADIDTDEATQAMFRYDMEASAKLLFGDTVKHEEFAAAIPSDRGDA